MKEKSQYFFSVQRNENDVYFLSKILFICTYVRKCNIYIQKYGKV